MNNVGVLKTKKGSPIFNSWLSGFIYTPTKKIKNYQEKSVLFDALILNLTKNLNIAPNIVKPLQKSALSPIIHPNPNPQSKSLSSYINTKIPRKIPIFTDYQFHTKFTYKYTSNKHQFFYISYLKIIILHNTINTNTKHLLPGIIRLNQRN